MPKKLKLTSLLNRLPIFPELALRNKFTELTSEFDGKVYYHKRTSRPRSCTPIRLVVIEGIKILDENCPVKFLLRALSSKNKSYFIKIFKNNTYKVFK